MIILGIPRSGRDGEFVYYMRGKNLCRRKYFIPTNVHTPGRSRARGSFGAVARAWGPMLTEEQRRAWNAAAAKVQSHPRLCQSGPLSGETHFTGINNSRSRIGREWLLWPPKPVVFGPNPVEGLSISEEQGRLKLRLNVTGPVVGDIMVFGAPPCSAGRKKWRHGSFLGLLPAPVGGESDITELYVARYGEPAPGQRVFIRTKQQRDGWEDHPRDVSGVVRVELAIAARRSGVFDTPTSRQLDLPLLLWRRGMGRGGRHAGKLLLPSSAIAFLPLSPTLSQRSAGGEREKPTVAVSKCSRLRGRGGMSLTLNELHGLPGLHGPKLDAEAGQLGTRCTTEQYRIYTGVSPSQYRPSTRSASRVRKIGPVCRALPPGEVRWRGHWRELWHGT